MIVRSELYFPDIVFEFPDPLSRKSKKHAPLASRLRAKLKHDSEKKPKDPPPPRVIYAENPHWTWPEVLRSLDTRLDVLRNRYGVVLPMERVDIEIVRRSSLVPEKGKKRDQLIDAYGQEVVDSIVGLHTRSSSGIHLIKVGYYSEQYSRTKTQVERTLTHELGHVFGEFPLFGVEYEELKGYAMQALMMGAPENTTQSTGSVVHDRSKGMLSQLGQMGICEPAILAHVTRSTFGEYGPQSYRDLRR